MVTPSGEATARKFTDDVEALVSQLFSQRTVILVEVLFN
jgi:hypothetical protein